VNERNNGVTADPVFLGVTRPPMRFGVTYLALLGNLVFTMEAFLLTKNLLVLLIAIPIHGVCALLCARDARYFDLLLVWGKTRMLGYFESLPFWRGASYSPLILDLPNVDGRRRTMLVAILTSRPIGVTR
jgi:type IV secretion system protein VirB3